MAAQRNMATLMQKRVARKVIEAIQSQEPITGGELVASVGYGPDMQRKPGEVLESKGVIEELEIMGFSEDKAKEVVAVILGDTELNPEPRLKAADMVFKVHGTYAPEKRITLTATVPNDRIKALAEKLNAH